MDYIFAVVITLLGVFMALAPETWWQLTESWKSNGTEPTEAFIRRTRLEGGLGAAVGIVCLVLLILIA